MYHVAARDALKGLLPFTLFEASCNDLKHWLPPHLARPCHLSFGICSSLWTPCGLGWEMFMLADNANYNHVTF